MLNKKKKIFSLLSHAKTLSFIQSVRVYSPSLFLSSRVCRRCRFGGKLDREIIFHFIEQMSEENKCLSSFFVSGNDREA